MHTLRNTFTGYTATKDQEHDLLHFYDIGQNDFDNIVKQTYLKENKIKHKKHQLKTMAPIKVTKRRMKTIEKEMKLITSCLRTRMVSGQQGTGEQFLELPRAIATEYGIPQKGQKSNNN